MGDRRGERQCCVPVVAVDEIQVQASASSILHVTQEQVYGGIRTYGVMYSDGRDRSTRPTKSSTPSHDRPHPAALSRL